MGFGLLYCILLCMGARILGQIFFTIKLIFIFYRLGLLKLSREPQNAFLLFSTDRQKTAPKRVNTEFVNEGENTIFGEKKRQ